MPKGKLSLQLSRILFLIYFSKCNILKVTKLDDISPLIFLNRTKAALNCAAGSMQVIGFPFLGDSPSWNHKLTRVFIFKG